MRKIFVPLPSKKNISLYLGQDFDGFFVGIKDFSSNFNKLFKIEELDDIISDVKKYNKKIFICFNRLYFNNEIDEVKKLLIKLNKMDIDGIMYTDIGVLNILNDINYKGDILWYSNHLGTNHKTINFLEKRKVNYALLSNEITIEEIIDIKKNTNINIGVTLYGFLNMATSSRQLLTNYFKYIKTKKNKNKYTMVDKVKNNKYIVVENKNTDFFTSLVLNGIKYYPILIKNDIDFIFLDDYMINENNFYNIIEAFSSLRSAYNDEEFINKLEEVVDVNTYYDTFNGFLDKKTVYKVEDYE